MSDGQDVPLLPDLNRLYIHPLFLVAGFIIHSATMVLFAVHIAPTIVAGLSISVTIGAVYWLTLGAAILLLALYRQRTMEGSVLAE